MTDCELEAFIISTYDTLTAREQTRRAGVNYTRLARMRRRLLASGALDPAQRAYSRPWSEGEDLYLASCLQLGMSVPQAAARVGRPLAGTRNHITRLGGTDVYRRAAGAEVRTLCDVARLFGCYKHAPNLWMRHGWLAVRHNNAKRQALGLRGKPKKGYRGYYLVTDDAILAFIENRMTWPAWEAARITDPLWREYAEDQRAAANGHWVSLGELTTRYHYARSTVQGWLARGKLDGVARTSYGHMHFFWSADLDAWQPIDRRIRQEAGQ